MKIKNIILDILFPKVCINCKREGKYICDKCKVFISETEPMIYTGECLDGLISVWDYEGLIKELIQMIKYQGVTDIIKELISLIDINPVRDSENSGETQTRSISNGVKVYCQYITYVPMYLKREKERGFNQAKLIARELAKKSNARSLSLLEKVVDTKDQAKLSKEERLENVKAAFAPLNGATVSQGNVLLVDDVFTTGATMIECCKVLKQAGIKKVWGFTLARTA